MVHVPVVFCLALFLELRNTPFLGLLFRRKNFNASLGDGKSFTVSSCCGNEESVVDGVDGASTATSTATARVATELEEERTSERRRSGGDADTGVLLLLLLLLLVVVEEVVCKSCRTCSY